MFLHFRIFIKALVCKSEQSIIFEMYFLLLCLSLLVSKKNVSPMEIPRDFPGALSHKKNGSETSIRALSPP